MSDKTIQLSIRRPPRNEELIASLQELLKRARSGQLRGVLVGVHEAGGIMAVHHAGEVNFSDWALLLHLASKRLDEALEGAREYRPDLPSGPDEDEEQ